MNAAEFSIKKPVIVWMIIILSLAGGLYAYFHIGRYEDPEFTIKEAKVITHYPGASAQEVEREVTDEVEMAVQQMGQVKRIESISKPGVSDISVIIKDKYTKNDLPQIWDELRRKVSDVQAQLPPGTLSSRVIDDYGDVYGTFYAVTGDGFSYKELKDYTDFLKQELSLVPGVAKVELVGNRQEAIFVDISRTRMSQLGISLTQIYQTLAAQNLVSTSGSVRVGDEYIRITPTGKIDSVAAIGDLLIHSTKSKKLLHLDDVATITRGYEEVPHNLIFYDGKPAIGVGISIVSGGNVVKIGQAVDQKLAQLQKLIPIGININSVYEQPKLVQQSVQSFVVSLLEALAIVFAVLLLFMGLRSGMIISAILMLTILGTLLLMYVFHIDLQRISLGALIIALGMLVDNAIVVTESILMKVQAGIDKLVAARDVVKQTSWPLFGATIVGILAFAPISLSQDSTGEYTRSLFYVISISLLLSWLFAVMIAPLFCHLFLPSKSKTEAANAESQLYNGAFYRCYKKFLIACLHKRWLVIIVMIVLLGSAVLGFKHVKQSFFPNATTPIFYVDYWRPQGSDIRATNRDMLKIDKYIKGLPGVDAVTGIVGQGAMRFMLVYKPENANSSYGQFVVKVGDYHQINALGQQILEYLTNNYPNSEPRIKRVMLGTGGDAKIEVRFSGPDANELRHLSSEAQAIMRQNSNTIEIRDDWRQRVKVIEPVFSQMQARLTGITRADLATALDTAFAGKAVGVYRDGDTLIPIVSRPPDNERLNIANIDDLQIWSPLLSKTVPIGQIVSKFNTNWEDSLLAKRDRKLTITVSCNPVNGMLASKLFKQLKPKIEAIKTPAGYEMQWGGEYEDSHDAQAALAQKLPIGFLAMFLVVVLLFNSIRQPLIIWLCVPLALIGVTAGLLITNVEFGFMALLGFLSLSGMLIKNAIVLVDQIDFDIKAGKQPWQAIIDSSLSRMRPVMLAAITTVLGMIPLLFDIFFANMAVTIMFGLTFATILTLVVVPVLYAILFKVRPKNV